MSWNQNFLGTQFIPSSRMGCNIYGASVGIGAAQVLSAAVRAAIIFHNPGTVPISVYPAHTPAGLAQILSFGAPGVLLVGAGEAWTVNPGGSDAWWAVASAVGASLTMLVF